MITDKNKAPKNLHYNVSNNSGSINKKFGKGDIQAAYDFAEAMKETAIIRGYHFFKFRGEWARNTVYMDHIFR